MTFEDGKMIGGPMSGPPPDFVICTPVPIPASGVMACRSGRSRHTFQGQTAPTCEGIVVPSKRGHLEGFSCNRCGLTHDQALIEGVRSYGAVL